MSSEDQILVDHQGRPIRLTAERWRHILEHPEMVEQRFRLAETLADPEVVIATEKDSVVHAYHRLYESTPVTRKYMVVAVKILGEDAFILTAYFTSQVKKGSTIWLK